MHDILNNPEFRARLYRKVDIDLFPNPSTGTPCWRWKGAKTKTGYGRIGRPKTGQLILTHRAAFLLEGGHIPTGKELDHLCRNRDCCNPQHLEVVTHSENLRRGNTHQNARIYDNRATAVTLSDRRQAYKRTKPRRSKSPLQSSFNFED